MTQTKVALVWSQFSPYHIDRCEACVQALGSFAYVLACEIATTSETYAWRPSTDVRGAEKITLFPGMAFERIPWWRIAFKMFLAFKGYDFLFVGVPYSHPAIIINSVLLRIFGVRVFVMTESKFDDRSRNLYFELFKSLVLAPYAGTMVGGKRQAEYMRFLGFNRRPLLEGYDTVGLARTLALGDWPMAPDGPDFEKRNFIFVGRFVEKKNILFLIDAFKQYVTEGGARKLILIGGGELDVVIRQRIVDCGLVELVHTPGFLQAEEIARALSSSLTLILPSTEEQWGLVVNEALAFSLPIIVLENVGSRDSLVRNLVNGFVLEEGNLCGLVRAMHMIGDIELWTDMALHSSKFRSAADTARFGLAVQKFVQSNYLL